MGQHTERFSGRVEAYQRYRPRFPHALLDFLRQHQALPQDAVVADVGAGTGMLAEVFLSAGHRVLAVEPNAEMLKACAALAGEHASLRVVAGTAEATTLADASVDLIAIGRAMHWFDWPRAHREFQRILRPAGWVLVATNGHRDSGAEVSQRLSAVLRRHRVDSCEADVRNDFARNLRGFLDEAAMQHTVIEHAMTVSFPTLLGYAGSLSAIPHPGERGYAAMAEELQAIFDTYQRDGLLTTPLSSHLYLGRLRPEFHAG